jgi:hypothetical protein
VDGLKFALVVHRLKKCAKLNRKLLHRFVKHTFEIFMKKEHLHVCLINIFYICI